jgi:hypothetical protein
LGQNGVGVGARATAAVELRQKRRNYTAVMTGALEQAGLGISAPEFVVLSLAGTAAVGASVLAVMGPLPALFPHRFPQGFRKLHRCSGFSQGPKVALNHVHFRVQRGRQ